MPRARRSPTPPTPVWPVLPPQLPYDLECPHCHEPVRNLDFSVPINGTCFGTIYFHRSGEADEQNGDNSPDYQYQYDGDLEYSCTLCSDSIDTALVTAHNTTLRENYTARKEWAKTVLLALGHRFDQWGNWEEFLSAIDINGLEPADAALYARIPLTDGSSPPPYLPPGEATANRPRSIRKPPTESLNAGSPIVTSPESAERFRPGLGQSRTRECPKCHNIFQVASHEQLYTCPKCDHEFDFQDMEKNAGVVDPVIARLESHQVNGFTVTWGPNGVQTNVSPTP